MKSTVSNAESKLAKVELSGNKPKAEEGVSLLARLYKVS